MRLQFGAGQVFLNPNGGNVPTNQTPQILATLQDFTLDISATIKDLRGQYQFPDDTAISDKKITWKSGSGRFDIDLYNNTFFGETAIVTGGQTQVVQEAHNVPATNPFTQVVTNSAQTPLDDLGVQYASTGQKFTKAASASAIGLYAYSAGTYTFNIADAGAAVLISYGYTAATGRVLTVKQHTQGWGPALEIVCSMAYQTLTGVVPNFCHLYSAKVTKLGIPLKRADYLITDIEGEAYANAAGNVADFYED